MWRWVFVSALLGRDTESTHIWMSVFRRNASITIFQTASNRRNFWLPPLRVWDHLASECYAAYLVASYRRFGTSYLSQHSSGITRPFRHTAWQRPPTTHPTTFHVWKTRGCQCSFRLLMMGDVSPETCWASYKYWIIKFWYIVASCLIFLYELYYEHGSTNIMCPCKETKGGISERCYEPSISIEAENFLTDCITANCSTKALYRGVTHSTVQPASHRFNQSLISYTVQGRTWETRIINTCLSLTCWNVLTL
jgi:hypothetical protein